MAKQKEPAQVHPALVEAEHFYYVGNWCLREAARLKEMGDGLLKMGDRLSELAAVGKSGG